MYFRHNSSAIKYVQNQKSTCVFSSFASALYDAKEHVEKKAIAYWLKSSFKSESLGYLNSINFANKIMTDRVREVGNQNLCYNMVKWVGGNGRALNFKLHQ